MCIREFRKGYPRIYASLVQESSVFILEARKSESFEYTVNTDSPPPSQYFSQQLVSEQVPCREA